MAPDPAEAKRLYTAAAALGNAAAMTNLGCLLVQEEAHQEAAAHFRTAADQGNVDAFVNLAEL